MNRTATNKEENNFKILILVATALFASFLINKIFFGIDRIVGDSMKPTLSANNWVVTNKQVYKNNSPQYGDVIIFRKKSVTKDIIVKRVIGLPNDTVEIKKGIVYINKKALHNTYKAMDHSETMAAIVVKENSYFVLGDNRTHSNDSRYWKDPFVYKDDIIGKVEIIVFPSIKKLL